MATVAVYHNLVWPKYKGVVFSALHELAVSQGLPISFVQIAETDEERSALVGVGVDLRYHRYPFELMFKGAYGAIAPHLLAWLLARHVVRNPARLIVLPGYHRPEYWAMLTACVLTGKRRAVLCDSTARDQAPNLTKTLLKRIFFWACHGYFAYGQRSSEYLQSLGASADRIFQPCQAAAMPIGFDPHQALRLRVEARAAQTEPRFLFVGRLSPEKDLPIVLQAFALMRQARSRGRLILVGDGPEAANLRAYAKSLCIADEVDFVGALGIAALSAHYAAASCLVLASRSEAWGLVVNEALHHGCPVVVSEACGCAPELVISGVTGYVHAVGDIADLAGCMTRAAEKLATTPADTERVGLACQALMRTYTPERAAQRMLAGCRSLLAEPQGAGSEK
jgi:glycosyltransferase involved in cell wall biosynthesis